MTAKEETETRIEALFVNYSFRRMRIGTAFFHICTYDKITLLSSIYMEKDFTRMSFFFFNLLKFPQR